MASGQVSLRSMSTILILGGLKPKYTIKKIVTLLSLLLTSNEPDDLVI